MSFWTDVSPNTRDPKRGYRFLLTIPAINQSWAVKSTEKPTWTIASTAHTFLNHEFHFPGKVTWNDIKVTMIDPITPYDTSYGAMQYLQEAGYRIPGVGTANTPYTIAKSKAVFTNPNHKYATPGNAPGAPSGGDFIIKTIDAEGNPIEEWRLFNAWISEAAFGEASYGAEDLLEIAISVKYDFANYRHTYKGDKAWKDAGQDSGFTVPDNPR